MQVFKVEVRVEVEESEYHFTKSRVSLIDIPIRNQTQSVIFHYDNFSYIKSFLIQEVDFIMITTVNLTAVFIL